jgi:hypothetical protein
MEAFNICILSFVFSPPILKQTKKANQEFQTKEPNQVSKAIRENTPGSSS